MRGVEKRKRNWNSSKVALMSRRSTSIFLYKTRRCNIQNCLSFILFWKLLTEFTEIDFLSKNSRCYTERKWPCWRIKVKIRHFIKILTYYFKKLLFLLLFKIIQFLNCKNWHSFKFRLLIKDKKELRIMEAFHKEGDTIKHKNDN